jgi:hypothetical protein
MAFLERVTTDFTHQLPAPLSLLMGEGILRPHGPAVEAHFADPAGWEGAEGESAASGERPYGADQISWPPAPYSISAGLSLT